MSRRRPRWWAVPRMAVKVVVLTVLFVALAVPAGAAAGFWALFNLDLPGDLPDDRNPRIRSMPTTVVDVNGDRIAEFREFELTVPVQRADVPQRVNNAFVAIEDRRFYEHEGVDPVGLVRAALANWRSGDVVQGGSTITQQYVKNTYTGGDRNLDRKVREALIASQLEDELSKDQILFRYLNTIYFGDGAYGIGAAAESYFRKPVSELTISESALLAGTVASPARYGPRVNIDTAEQRRMTVLRAMRDQDLITQLQFRRAARAEIFFAPFGEPPGPATVVHTRPRAGEPVHPYFVDYVRGYLEEAYGSRQVYRGGLRIETTIDPVLQAQAEAAVAQTLAGTNAPLEMSLVSVDPATGHVKAFVGGRDFAQSQVNLGLGGSLGMQPGSSFKTFVLAAALEQYIEPDSLWDAPAEIEFEGCGDDDCTVANYDFAARGEISLREATHSSVNTVYASVAQEIGTGTVAEMASRLGVSSVDPEDQYGISLSLGAYEVSPLDMAAGYATIANRGVRNPVTPVLRVYDAQGRVLEDNSAPQGEAVLATAVADHTTDILRGVVTDGTGKSADIGRPSAGKTGTAQDYRAAWYVGYTPQLSTSVWMGYSDSNRPLRNVQGVAQVSGGSLPAVTWARFMRSAHTNRPVVDFAPPGPLPEAPPIAPVEPQPDREPNPLVVVEGSPSTPDAVPNDCGGPCARVSTNEVTP